MNGQGMVQMLKQRIDKWWRSENEPSHFHVGVLK
jgi:hypothetical protein